MIICKGVFNILYEEKNSRLSKAVRKVKHLLILYIITSLSSFLFYFSISNFINLT